MPILCFFKYDGGASIEFAFIRCSMSCWLVDRKLNPVALRHSALQAKKNRRGGLPRGILRAGLLANEPLASGELPFI